MIRAQISIDKIHIKVKNNLGNRMNSKQNRERRRWRSLILFSASCFSSSCVFSQWMYVLWSSVNNFRSIWDHPGFFVGFVLLFFFFFLCYALYTVVFLLIVFFGVLFSGVVSSSSNEFEYPFYIFCLSFTVASNFIIYSFAGAAAKLLSTLSLQS